MSTVVADMSMSLERFVAGPNDEVDEVFPWLTAGEVTVESEDPDLGSLLRRAGGGSGEARAAESG